MFPCNQRRGNWSKYWKSHLVDKSRPLQYTFYMEEFEEILKDIQSKESEDKEFEIWLDNGIERGWITEPFCNTHDGDPYMTEEEQQEWEDGGDPCQVVFKIKE